MKQEGYGVVERVDNVTKKEKRRRGGRKKRDKQRWVHWGTKEWRVSVFYKTVNGLID